MGQSAVLQIGVKNQAGRTVQTLAAADVPVRRKGAFDAVGAVPEGVGRWTGRHVGRRRRQGCSSSQSVVDAVLVVAVVGNYFAEVFGEVQSIPRGAVGAVAELHVEDGCGREALDAAEAVEEGSGEGTVVDRGVEETSLVVLVDEVGDGLPAEDPVAGV